MLGKPTGAKVSGYRLLHQFEVSDGYLLVADYDCPYEEEVSITLLDRDFHVLDHRSIGAPYSSYLLKSIDWRDPRHFVISFQGIADHWQFIIEPWGIPFIRRRLGMKRIKD
ncbi:MAG: hypothetical protein ACREPV_01710 [Lysobacter sp.]